jgi:hypothetical protein
MALEFDYLIGSVSSLNIEMKICENIEAEVLKTIIYDPNNFITHLTISQ